MVKNFAHLNFGAQPIITLVPRIRAFTSRKISNFENTKLENDLAWLLRKRSGVLRDSDLSYSKNTIEMGLWKPDINLPGSTFGQNTALLRSANSGNISEQMG